MRKLHAPSVTIALLLAVQAAAQADVTRTGKTFVVTLHAGKLDEAIAAKLADDALAAAESLRPALDKFSLRPARPPVVHVHVDEGPFRTLAAETMKVRAQVDAFVQMGAGCVH